MENQKVLSIIVPIYNAEKTIKRCVVSLLEQTYKSLQILLINDGSTDNSEKICKNLAEKDLRIEYYYKPNSGVSETRNFGLKLAKGEYITFVDSDDFVYSNCYEIALTHLINDRLDLIVFGFTSIEKNRTKDVIYQNIRLSSKKEIATYVAHNFESSIVSLPWNKVYKKKYIIDEFSKNISLGEDLLFNICYFQRINNLQIINRVLYAYDRTNENSLTNRYESDYFDAFCIIYRNAKKYITGVMGKDKVSLSKLNDKFISAVLHFVRMEVKLKKRAEAIARIKYIVGNKLFEVKIMDFSKKREFVLKIGYKLLHAKRVKTLYFVSKVYNFFN